MRRQLDTLLDSLETGHVEVCVPKQLTRKYLAAHTPAGVPEVEWTEFARYIVSRVMIATLNKDFKRGSRKWVSLPIAAFKNLAPARYRLMRKALLELGILHCDDTYSYTQGTTYGYRLGKRYRKQPFKFRHLRASQVLQRLQAWNRSELKWAKQQLSSIVHVAKGWLDYPDINLDQAKALEFLDRYQDVLLLEMHSRTDSKRRGWKLEKSERVAWVHNQVLHAQRQVEGWGQRPSLSVDRKGGRFYHPLTSLLSPLRNFVTYKGSPLVSFDLKNSQPLHLLLVTERDFWQEKPRQSWALRKLDEELWTATQEGLQELRAGLLQGDFTDSPSIELHNPGQPLENEDYGVTHFAELVRSGKLYEFIAQKFGGKFFTSKGVDRFGSRDLAKREVLRLMYFNNANPRSAAQPTFREFQRLFPGIAGLMELLKRRDYTDFSVLLQKLEVYLMLEKVCRRLYDRAPEAWFTTIHDSIITTAEHADLVQEIMLATYEEVLKVAPAIERSDLHPDAAFHDLFDYVQRKIDKNIGEGESKEVKDSRQRVEHWLRTQLTGVDASLAYPFGELADTPSRVNPFEVIEESSEGHAPA